MIKPNIFLDDNELFNYEMIWRTNQKAIQSDYDYFDKVKPFPKKYFNNPSHEHWLDHNINWGKKLIEIQKILTKKRKYKNLKKKLKDPLNKKNTITTKIYTFENFKWYDSYLYFIKEYTMKPSMMFKTFIDNIVIRNNTITIKKNKLDAVKFSSSITKKNGVKYIKLKQNQLRVFDALFIDGSNKIFKSNSGQYKFSEYSGLLDFDNGVLEKVVINTKATDDDDDDVILLPENIDDFYDYEFIFHTHPATDGIGGRVKDGILYEFPSVSDLFHFAHHYNEGDTQGSIVIAPEGLYLIRAINNKKKIAPKNITKVINNLEDYFFEVQGEAIKKYPKINKKIFYTKIANDKTFIRKINNKISQYNIEIIYKSRQKIKNFYVLKNIFLPVY